MEDVIFGDLFMAPSRFDVHVQDGVVVLQGCCERRSLIPTVVWAVEAVEGVVQVVNRLGYDSTTSPRRCLSRSPVRHCEVGGHQHQAGPTVARSCRPQGRIFIPNVG